MHTITKKELEQKLAQRINETEANIDALKAVTINTDHKTLTNRAVTFGEHGGRIGDYISIGKALYVYYKSYNKHETETISAYTYNNPDGTEIGANGIHRISRTVTPTELQASVNSLIATRERELLALKKDLANAGKIVTKYNKLAEQLETLENSVTWATRGVMR